MDSKDFYLMHAFTMPFIEARHITVDAVIFIPSSSHLSH